MDNKQERYMKENNKVTLNTAIYFKMDDPSIDKTNQKNDPDTIVREIISKDQDVIHIRDVDRTVPYCKSAEKSHLTEAPIIQVVKRSKSYMNHTYRDYSRIPPEPDYIPFHNDINNMSFVQKVHHILSQERFRSSIHWQRHGRAFIVVVPKKLESDVLPRYFGHGRYSSFLRQLSNHGFKHISSGVDRNSHYHELMLRGLPHICSLFPAPKDSRRLLPDPENEPNFYEISRTSPVPENTDSPIDAQQLSQSSISSPSYARPLKRSNADIGQYTDGSPTKYVKQYHALHSSLKSNNFEYDNSITTDIKNATLSAFHDFQSSRSSQNSISADPSNVSDIVFPVNIHLPVNSMNSILQATSMAMLHQDSRVNGLVDPGVWSAVIPRPTALASSELMTIACRESLAQRLNQIQTANCVMPERVGSQPETGITQDAKPLFDPAIRYMLGSPIGPNQPNNSQQLASLAQEMSSQPHNNQLQTSILSHRSDISKLAAVSQVIGQYKIATMNSVDLCGIGMLPTRCLYHDSSFPAASKLANPSGSLQWYTTDNNEPQSDDYSTGNETNIMKLMLDLLQKHQEKKEHP